MGPIAESRTVYAASYHKWMLPVVTAALILFGAVSAACGLAFHNFPIPLSIFVIAFALVIGPLELYFLVTRLEIDGTELRWSNWVRSGVVEIEEIQSIEWFPLGSAMLIRYRGGDIRVALEPGFKRFADELRRRNGAIG